MSHLPVGSPIAEGYWVNVDGVQGFVQCNDEGWIIAVHTVNGEELTRRHLEKLASKKVQTMLHAWRNL